MTSWPPIESLSAIDLSLVGALKPEQVLYEFDGPCIFTSTTPHGLLLLAYLSEDIEDEKLLRFVVSTSSEKTVRELQAGATTVREALHRGSLWLVDLDYAYTPQRAARVAAEQLPEDALPPRTTMLRADLEPSLIVRLKGPEIRPGEVPAAAFLQAAEIAGKGLKPVFDWAARKLREDKGGRPPAWLRDLYGLSAQRFAFGSLEVALRVRELPPEQPELQPLERGEIPTTRKKILRDAWQAIREGMTWAASGDETLPDSRDDEKWRAILESIKRMAPPSTGAVDSVEVWGQAVGRVDTPFQIDRCAAKKIRSRLTELKKAQDVQLRVFEGRVRDLDLDRLTFIMRDVDGMGDVNLELDDEQLLEVAREAHYQELDVSVVARSEDAKRWTASEIEFIHPREPTKTSA